jgi:hypothetical protein
VYAIRTIQLGPQIIGVEKFECLDRLKIIYMFLWHLRYLKQPQLILIVDQSTTLRNTKHHQSSEYHPEHHKTSIISVPPSATQNITNVYHYSMVSVLIFFHSAQVTAFS